MAVGIEIQRAHVHGEFLIQVKLPQNKQSFEPISAVIFLIQMKTFLVLFAQALVKHAKMMRPNGKKTIIAENLLLKHQLIVINRTRKRAPNLSALDRFVLGCCSLFISQRRLTKLTVIFQPSTLLKFHKALVKRKYHILFSSRRHSKPGPKGPPKEIIQALSQ